MITPLPAHTRAPLLTTLVTSTAAESCASPVPLPSLCCSSVGWKNHRVGTPCSHHCSLRGQVSKSRYLLLLIQWRWIWRRQRLWFPSLRNLRTKEIRTERTCPQRLRLILWGVDWFCKISIISTVISTTKLAKKKQNRTCLCSNYSRNPLLRPTSLWIYWGYYEEIGWQDLSWDGLP